MTTQRANRPYNPHPRNITIQKLKTIYDVLDLEFVELNMSDVRSEYFNRIVTSQDPVWWPADYDHVNSFDRWSVWYQYLKQPHRLTMADATRLTATYVESFGDDLPREQRRLITIARSLAHTPLLRTLNPDYRAITYCENHPAVVRLAQALGRLNCGRRQDAIYDICDVWRDIETTHQCSVPLHAEKLDGGEGFDTMTFNTDSSFLNENALVLADVLLDHVCDSTGNK